MVVAAQELRGKNVTQKFLDSLLASLKQKFAENHIDFRAPFPRKVVKFRYRLQEVEAYCMSHFDHWMLLQEAHVKTVALQNNLLPPLFCEDELAPLSPTDTQCTVEPALLERNMRAREAASEYLPLASEHTGPNISHLMSKRILALLQLDRFFKIEAAFFLGQVGAAAEQRVKKMVLERLPSVDAPAKKTIEGSLEALERLATQRIITFSGPGPAAALQSVLEIVRALSEHAKPRFENYSNCSFFSEAKQRCELLAKHKEKAPSGKLLVGREAAVAMLGDLQKASSGTSEDKKVAYTTRTTTTATHHHPHRHYPTIIYYITTNTTIATTTTTTITITLPIAHALLSKNQSPLDGITSPPTLCIATASIMVVHVWRGRGLGHVGVLAVNETQEVEVAIGVVVWVGCACVCGGVGGWRCARGVQVGFVERALTTSRFQKSTGKGDIKIRKGALRFSDVWWGWGWG